MHPVNNHEAIPSLTQAPPPTSQDFLRGSESYALAALCGPLSGFEGVGWPVGRAGLFVA